MENNSIDLKNSEEFEFLPSTPTDENVETFESEVFVPLSMDEAAQLTEDIKATSTALYALLKRAHDTKAWISLGYKSWTDYIETEFEFSRARSYQLINQAIVIEEINKASGVPLYITEKEARDIKKRLPEITKKLEEDVKEAGLEGEEAEEKAKEIIARENHYDEDDYSGEVDNADDYEREKDNYIGGDNTNYGEDEYEPPSKAKLTQEEEFLYEKLLITLHIFESIPDPETFAKLVRIVEDERASIIKSAQNSIEWLNELLDKIK